jgi:hypothetical protein
MYVGDWAQNVRHGNGLFELPDGMKYEGQWVNDRKHGSGRLTHKDGTIVKGIWINDKLNGLARFKNPGMAYKTIIYKEDMAIQSDEGLN